MPNVYPDLISVVMSTRDPLYERTRRALVCLEKSTVPYELILLNRKHEWTTAGYVNQGIAASVGEYVLFLDDDCFVEPNTLAFMRQALTYKDIGIVGALLLYGDGQTVQHAGGFCCLSEVEGGITILAAHHGHFQPLVGLEIRCQPVDYVTGACMMVRRDVIDEIGGYHPDCDLAWGDTEYCLRARAAGYTVLFEPNARAIHLESQTRGMDMGSADWLAPLLPGYEAKGVLERRAVRLEGVTV